MWHQDTDVPQPHVFNLRVLGVAYTDGLEQDYSISIRNALDKPQSGTEPEVTPGNPFAYPGINITPLLLFTWKMFIMIDLSNIHVLESIYSRI